MNDRTNRTVICSVAFLDIVDYSRRVGQEQVLLKKRFNALITEVVKDIAPNDRVLIDTGDGAALCFTGDPEDALFVVMNLRDRLLTPECEKIGLTLRIGINLGPVRLIHDINNHQNVIGDGINVAQRVMSFAQPNQIMVSRTYFEVVSRLSQEFTKLFHYAGARTDKHVREHEIYAVGAGQDEPAEAPAEPRPKAPPEPKSAAPAEPRREASAEPRPATRSHMSPPGRIAGFVDTTMPLTAKAKGAESTAFEPEPSVPKRNKSLLALAAAIVVAVGVVVFAAMHFKSDKQNVTTPTEAAAVPAASPSSPAASPSALTAAGPASTEKSDADARVAAAKSEAAAKVASAKADLDPKAAPPAPKFDGHAKAPAVRAKAPEPPPATALPPVAAAKSAKPEMAKTEARKDAPKANVKDNAAAKGTLEFWINPFGEVYIDGKSVGTSPPLKVYDVATGTHQVEIFNDNAGFPHKETVEVTAGAIKRVNKTFR